MGRKNKRGTISVDFLITVILLIVGFVIIFLFYINLGGTGQLDRTVCHTSVIYRATLPSLFQDYVSLKCQTNKICVTSGLFTFTGNCSAFKGETGITTVKVPGGSAGEHEIEQIYAQEIYDCWQTMGEGKVSLWNQWLAQNYGFGSVYPTCTICTRLAFDYDKLQKSGINMDNVNIQNYMLTHLAPDSNLTYFEAIVGAGGKFSTMALQAATPSQTTTPSDTAAFAASIGAPIKSTNNQPSASDLNNALTSLKGDLQMGAPDRKINFSKDSTAVLFMQITSPSHGDTTANFFSTIGGLLGLNIVSRPTSFFNIPQYIPKGTEYALTAAEQKIIGSATYINEKGFFSGSFGLKSGAAKAGLYAAIAVAIVYGLEQTNVAWQRSITAGTCGDTSIGTNARNGCSVVRAVPYEPDIISTYCSVIEGSP